MSHQFAAVSQIKTNPEAATLTTMPGSLEVMAWAIRFYGQGCWSLWPGPLEFMARAIRVYGQGCWSLWSGPLEFMARAVRVYDLSLIHI